MLIVTSCVAVAKPVLKKSASAKPSIASSMEQSEAASAPAPPALKRSLSAKPATSTASKAAPKEKKEDNSSEADVASGTSTEQLDELAEQTVPSEMREKLSSANWKERLEAAEGIETLVKDTAADMAHPVPEAIVRLLYKAVVEKKETNFQVASKVFSAVQILAEKAQKTTKRSAHWFIAALVEKLGDVKLRTPSSDCLLMLCEACSPQFVLTQAFDALEKQKSPKVHENGLLWINTVATDFGLK